MLLLFRFFQTAVELYTILPYPFRAKNNPHCLHIQPFLFIFAAHSGAARQKGKIAEKPMSHCGETHKTRRK